MLFSLADSWLSVNQHSHELACADGWSVPGNECSALPSLSPVSTFHIQYYTNAEPSPFPPHFPPAVSCNYPLTAFFFSPQHKMWPAAPHSRTEKVWVCLLPQLSWHPDVLSMQEIVTVRERDGKTDRWLELRGYTNTTNIRDLSINQAVTTRCLSNWIVLAALRERRPF